MNFTTTMFDSILSDQNRRLITYVPKLLWHLLVSIYEWIVPPLWYAKDVSNDIVLVTGAGSGLGRAIALEFAKLGSSLVLWDINEAGLEETKLQIYEEHADWINMRKSQENANQEDIRERFCLSYVVDVSDRIAVENAKNRLMTDMNEKQTENNSSNGANDGELYVSILVNNAGIYHGLLFDDLNDKHIERIFKINVLSHFWTVKSFLPHMKKHDRGHIVEIASMGGISGLFKQVDYCATKFATVGFEESLSIELDYLGLADKIKTTVICPFFFSSNLFSGFDSKFSGLMTSDFVAKETVIATRCNHARVLLPKMSGYSLQIIKSLVPRKAMIDLNRALGLDESIKTIKGHAATASTGA